MANNTTLKAAIAAVVKANGNNEITGQIMQDALFSIINQFGSGQIFKGIAVPATSPGAVDANVFYIASQPGTYANFGGYVLAGNKIVLFSNETGAFVVKEIFNIDLSTYLLKVDATPKIIVTDDIAFTQEGYYSNAGVLTASANFHSTPITDINNSIVVRGTSEGTASVSNICYFNSSNVFVGYVKFDVQKMLLITDFPVGAVKFAASKQKNNTTGFARTGVPEFVTNTYIDVLNKSKKDRVPTFNYFPNYSMLNAVNYPASNATALGTNGWDLINDSTFDKVGHSGHLSRTTTVVGNTSFFVFGSNYFKASLIANKQLNLRLFIKSSVSATLSFQLFRKNAVNNIAAGTFAKTVVANEITEILWSIPIADDITTIEYFTFFLIGAPIATYKITGVQVWDGAKEFLFVQNLLSKNDIETITAGTAGYANKKFLFIGDSISNANDRYWKGYLFDNFKIIYLAQNLGAFSPAQGGKVLFPRTIADDPTNWSIWYLCGNQRLVDYNPNFINLFGGTNDLNDVAIPLGTALDAPYLDTDGSRPVGLTWASCLKGCIVMLQRDFPGIEIIVNTVLDTEYGTADYDGTYTRKEFVARLQMQIADLYNLKCVPFFWCTGITMKNNRMFTSDGVHPNRSGGRRMANCYAETLFLK